LLQAGERLAMQQHFRNEYEEPSGALSQQAKKSVGRFPLLGINEAVSGVL